MTVFAGQLVRLHLLSVQRIGDLRGHRQLLVCFSLIVNIISAGLPYHVAVLVCGIGLIAFDILHI